MSHFRVLVGQAFIAAIPCYIKNADGTQSPIVASAITDFELHIRIKFGEEITTGFSVTRDAYNNILVNFPNGIANEVYSLKWSGKYGGRPVKSVYLEAFEGVCINRDATYQNFVVGSRINLPDTIFVLSADTSAVQSIIAQLNAKVVEYEAKIAEYTQKIAELTDVAKQTTLSAVKSFTDRIGIASAGKPQTLFGALENIEFDTSDLAKEATLGTANDTAASATIFGKIANLLATWNTWVAGAWATLVSNVSAVKTETDKIGTATSQTNNTLFKALENINFDKSDLAKVGSDPTATMTALKTAIAAIPTTQVTGYALQGNNPNINLTTMDAKLGNIIIMTAQEKIDALADLDTHLV